MDNLSELSADDWKLLAMLRDKPHPNLRDIPLPADLHVGVGEVLQQARIAHHLLDLGEIPKGRGQDADLDARVALMLRAAMRLRKVADLHQPDRNYDGHGGNSGFCVECGWAWPCATAQVVMGERDDEP